MIGVVAAGRFSPGWLAAQPVVITASPTATAVRVQPKVVRVTAHLRSASQTQSVRSTDNASGY
jgi:hypothetical protein